jgi:hypothetical protein
MFQLSAGLIETAIASKAMKEIAKFHSLDAKWTRNQVREV